MYLQIDNGGYPRITHLWYHVVPYFQSNPNANSIYKCSFKWLQNKHFRSEMTCKDPQKNDTSQDLTLSKHVKTLATLARDQDTWWLFGHMLFIHCRWRFWHPLFIQARWCFGHPLLIQASWCFGHPLLIQASWWSRCFRHPLPFWTCEMWSFNGFHMFPCLLKAQISSNF